MFRLPYSLLPVPKLRSLAPIAFGLSEKITPMFPYLEVHLKQSELEYSVHEYLSMCLTATGLFSVFIGFFIFLFTFVLFGTEYVVITFFILLIIILFVFFQQIMYPRLLAQKRVRGIERNLMPALQNMLIQLQAGVPLFEIMVNISKEGYGEVSDVFLSVVKEINAGKPQIEALEDIAAINPSLFFRRSVWQLVNGMKSGADMANVINEIIDLLSEEQVLQIQRYGSQLNPIAMFYMLAVVIAPSLGMTFLIILSSFISLSEDASKLIFWGLYGGVFFLQLMFIGVIKSKRPNLLGD